MKDIMLFILLLFCGIGHAQERFFDRAIKKGRETGGLYKVEIKDGSVVKRNILKKYSNEYILRNIETQTVNRFGDKYEGVKSFEFLPIGEIFQFVYDNKLTPELSNYQSNFREAITKGKKASLYFFDIQNNTFNLFKDFYWNGEVRDGMVQGKGVGVYYNEYNGIALGVRGNFSNGILDGNGTFISYKFNGLDLFDSGKTTVQTITLSGFQDGMVALSVDTMKGFVNEEMLIKINPKFRNVLQPFKEGRAVEVNENNEEIIIDKEGGFIEYTSRQKQVFEERKKAEEARQRAIVENEIRTEYIEAVNAERENPLLLFYKKYRESEYDFARRYASEALNKAKQYSLLYEVPFKEAAFSDYGDRLVKIIVASKDGTPVSLAAENLYNYLDGQYILKDSSIYLTEASSNGKKVFTALNKPVSFLDKSVINGVWYEEIMYDTAELASPGWAMLTNAIETFAHNNEMSVRYISYWSNMKHDTSRYQKEHEQIKSFLSNNCTRAEIERAENPDASLSSASTGQITMKSGEVYTWVFDGESFSIKVSWIDGKFSTFAEMIEGFKQGCLERFCG